MFVTSAVGEFQKAAEEACTSTHHWLYQFNPEPFNTSAAVGFGLPDPRPLGGGETCSGSGSLPTVDIGAYEAQNVIHLPLLSK